jgi:dTDP-4-amino-4,6-dideoxygalactose transaminase
VGVKRFDPSDLDMVSCASSAQGVQLITSENLVVPFNKTSLLGKELAYVQEAIQGLHISGDGRFTKLCNQFIEQHVDVKSCMLTTSCTDALEMSALLLDIQPGDEVIIPTYTFVSTVNAFVLRGAKPVFVDVRPDTLNLDENQLAKKINRRTKAVVPVHYAGVGCEMDAIQDICRESGVKIVEDNAHGLFGKYKGRNLGTFGSLATQSFHETKNFSCGEGGALLINEPELVERAEILRDKGTNRKRFFRGEVDKYTWVDIGSSFLPSDMLAAFLYGQLECFEEVQERRRQLWHYYYDHLSSWAHASEVKLPTVPAHCDQSYHMFYLIGPSAEWRNQLMTYLKEQRIHAVFHYLPLHLSAMGEKFGGRSGDCPVAEDISARLLRLPFFTSFETTFVM